MNQPNDIAMSADGTLWASDPDWKNSTGQLWRIDTNGKVTKLASGMGTTNGIDVSPDGKILYVNESNQRNVWAFDIQPDKSIYGKRLLVQFPDHGMDGMRCDVDGNLWCGWGMGTAEQDGVKIFDPSGKAIGFIALPERCANVCFGGPRRNRLYICGSTSLYAVYTSAQGALKP